MELFMKMVLALAFIISIHAEYVPDAEELLLQRMLDEIEQAYETPSRDSVNPPDADLMYRERKEGQVSVYSYSPSIRDQEYLQHSSLWGYQSVAGGNGEGYQRLRPDGSGNVQVVKSDAVLPAYCNPPNPCPAGYTAEDGCLETFSNTAAFSREYQQQQECMCDTEHMFDCPGATKEEQINVLASQFSNDTPSETDLNTVEERLAGKSQPVEGQHKSLVAKKFFNKDTHKQYTKMLSDKNKNEEQKSRVRRSAVMKKNSTETPSMKAKVAKKLTINPYLQGEKLPVVAKKG